MWPGREAVKAETALLAGQITHSREGRRSFLGAEKPSGTAHQVIQRLATFWRHFEYLLCTVRIVIVITRGEDGMAQRDEDVVRSEGAAYDRRRFLRQAGLGVAGIAGGMLLDAGASSASPLASRLAGRADTGAATRPCGSCTKGRQINLIALPDNWANYGTQSMKNTVIGDFYANYKITCNSVAPDDSSAQELAAIKANKGTSKEPDVVDVSAAIAVDGCCRTLLRALQGADLGRNPEQHEGSG